LTLKEATPMSRVERKKDETRRKLCSVALHLFKQQGLEATTMELIAEQADVAKGTLYNYFPSKEALINEIMQQSFKEKNPARFAALRLMPDTRSRTIHIYRELAAGVQSQMDLFEKYLIHQMHGVTSLNKVGSEKSGIEQLAYEIIRLGQESGEIRDDLALYLLADLFEFAFIEVMKPLFLAPETFNADQAIEQCADLFIAAIRA
jgi:AcrR family transcriptional regulator